MYTGLGDCGVFKTFLRHEEQGSSFFNSSERDTILSMTDVKSVSVLLMKMIKKKSAITL